MGRIGYSRRVPERKAGGSKSKGGARTGAATGQSREPARTGTFNDDFESAFKRLESASSFNNYVMIHDLRKALPQYTREQFDAGLRKLRIDRKFSADTDEGLHFHQTPEQRASGIPSNDGMLQWISKR